MKKQRIMPGTLLEIYIKEKYYVYAQVLEKSYLAFFNYKSESPIKDFDLLNRTPLLFIISVYKNSYTDGQWKIVGKWPLREDLKILPNQFIQNAINSENFEIYNPNNGEISSADKSNIVNLERSAVWEKNHVEDRIDDYFNNKQCKWLVEDRELFNRSLP